MASFTIGWNYLPNAGGSIIRPHIAPLAGPKPPAFTSDLIVASRRYAAEHGHAYWADYIDAEPQLGSASSALSAIAIG